MSPRLNRNLMVNNCAKNEANRSNGYEKMQRTLYKFWTTHVTFTFVLLTWNRTCHKHKMNVWCKLCEDPMKIMWLKCCDSHTDGQTGEPSTEPRVAAIKLKSVFWLVSSTASTWWQMEAFFRVTGPLCGEFPCLRWIPHTKTSDGELWCFLWSAPE